MSYEKAYDYEKQNPNNLSSWFPKIKDCGIKVPETMIFTVPITAFIALNEMDEGGDMECVRRFIYEDVIPQMNGSQYFLKNGCFSNKFDFRSCITGKTTLYTDYLNISYASMCMGITGTGGMTELILRGVIPHDPRRVPAIYNGMPLRTEIRVFYDFDAREVLYSANYWDYDYVRPHLQKRTDRIIFDHMRDEIKSGFDKHDEPVKAMIADHLKTVDLTGKWSVDVLVDDRGAYWLIDMAEAARSAYWKYDINGNPLPPPEPFDPAEQAKHETERYEKLASCIELTALDEDLRSK